MLPDESGYDIIKKLRLNSATKRLPVIMVTAKSTELDMIKGARMVLTIILRSHSL